MTRPFRLDLEYVRSTPAKSVIEAGFLTFRLTFSESDRISFDFNAAINVPSDHYRRWTIHVPQGETRVDYAYQKEVDWDRYVALAERSRAAEIAKPFGGRVVSNSVQVFIE